MKIDDYMKLIEFEFSKLPINDYYFEFVKLKNKYPNLTFTEQNRLDRLALQIQIDYEYLKKSISKIQRNINVE